MAHYSDINQYAGEEGAVEGGLLTEIDAVVQHIDNLILIKPGELLFRDTGIDLERITFKHVDMLSAQEIYSMLHEGILQFEPRVRLGGGSRVLGNRDTQTWDIALQITIAGIDGYYTYTGKIHHRDSGEYE